MGNESESEIILEIFGDESLEGGKLTQDLSHDIEYYHPIILGHASYPQNMTLVECRWHGTKAIGKNLYQIKYHVRTILRHALFESKDHLLLNSIKVCVPHVASWYDGWKSHTKIKAVNEESETSQTLKINERLTIRFIDSIIQRTLIFGKSQETNYQKYLEFKYTNDQPLERIIHDIIRFTRLLEFSFSKSVNFKLISAITSNKNVQGSDGQFGNTESTLIYFDNYSYVQKQDVYKDGIHQNQMLFSKWAMDKDSLNEIIIKWFNTNQFNHIYDLYLDSHNWFEGTNAVLSNVMYNNRCLNLIQGLEDYHRKIMSNSESEKHDLNERRTKKFIENKKMVLKSISENQDLKKWVNDTLNLKIKEYSLKERLVWLVEKSNPILPELFEDDFYFNDFPNFAKEYRDMLSHGNLENTFLGDEFDRLFLMARLLLTICILQSLELDNTTISQLLKHKTDFRRNVYEIKIKGHNNN